MIIMDNSKGQNEMNKKKHRKSKQAHTQLIYIQSVYQLLSVHLHSVNKLDKQRKAPYVPQ